MADVGGQEHLARRGAGNDELAVGEGAVLELAVDHDPVQAVLQALPLRVREAEAPALLVVGGDVGDRVGLALERVEVLLQLGERQGGVDGDRVADDVQVVLLEVDDPVAVLVEDVGIADVPLGGHGPVEDPGAGGHLVDRQGQVLAEDAERLAHAVAGDAPADREQAPRERVHRRAGRIRWRPPRRRPPPEARQIVHRAGLPGPGGSPRDGRRPASTR